MLCCAWSWQGRADPLLSSTHLVCLQLRVRIHDSRKPEQLHHHLCILYTLCWFLHPDVAAWKSCDSHSCMYLATMQYADVMGLHPWLQGAQSAAYGNALPFAALNGALASDVACIVVPAGVHIQQPLHVLYLSTGQCSEPASLLSHMESAASAVTAHFSFSPPICWAQLCIAQADA